MRPSSADGSAAEIDGMANLADFLFANANAQRLVTDFGREVTARRQRAKTDASRAKWARAQALASRSAARIEFACELANEVRESAQSVIGYHGTFEAVVASNPWIGEKLAGAMGILTDVEQKLSRYRTVIEKITSRSAPVASM